MNQIVPGILEKEWEEIEKKIELVRDFSKVIHIDLIDGKFAPSTTFLDPEPFKKYSKEVFFELHMMVEEPINYLEGFAQAGFKRFLGHIEKMSSQEDFVAKAEFLGEVGLALDFDTSLDSLKADFEDLDLILIMSVKAGLSGQSFIPEALEKVKEIKKKSDIIPIEIDGGVNDSTILQALDCGVSRFVSTSFLYDGDILENYKKLTSAIGFSAKP